jgi:hypothetical protein
MALTRGKNIVEEKNGIRCTVVEKGTSPERIAFLKDLLAFNKFEVLVEEEKKPEETVPATFVIGVTDIVFNPMISVYQQNLRTPTGEKVCPAYWNRYTIENDSRYWMFVN